MIIFKLGDRVKIRDREGIVLGVRNAISYTLVVMKGSGWTLADRSDISDYNVSRELAMEYHNKGYRGWYYDTEDITLLPPLNPIWLDNKGK